MLCLAIPLLHIPLKVTILSSVLRGLLRILADPPRKHPSGAAYRVIPGRHYRLKGIQETGE